MDECKQLFSACPQSISIRLATCYISNVEFYPKRGACMAKAAATHERLTQEARIKGSSDRSFGIVFTCVFAIVGVWPLMSDGGVRLWSIMIAAVFLALALFRPVLLAPLNRYWMKLGLLLNRVVSPLVMAFLFYGTVTPIGLLMRVLGKDPLRLQFEPKAKSYWIERRPPGPAPDTMTNQF